ncbi:alpha/beta hydrolase family protein [Cryptosporangium arvum]|uniref:alpha/beta hydrolase family protein n=1 Tax=Cryptosporangium arvum TaxID=80871 RepID=UPI0004B4CE26|nr:alpha/beta hydrolase [Cryptosporangium arvum]
MRLTPPRAALAVATVATALAGAVAVAAPPATAQPPAATRHQAAPLLTLPEPTGTYAVGTTPLHLVDTDRADPWGDGKQRRELMINIWYPARTAAGHTRFPWLTPAEAGPVGRDFVQTLTGAPGVVGGVDAVRTHGAVGAPVARKPGGHPVVLFSPGYGAERNSSAALVEDLASRGYVVVTIDHPHDATAVRFPDGRTVPNTINALLEKDPDTVIRKALDVRVADTRFVLDELQARHPRWMRLEHVGMVGHSLGGATAAQVAHDDPRVTAGIDMDGNPYGSVVTDGLDKPFLQIASGSTTRENTPDWGTFSDHLRGWHREIKVVGTEHLSFHDVVLARAKLAEIPGIAPAILTEAFGTLDGRRTVTLERAYVSAFFDLHLRGVDRHLFDRAVPAFPEVTLV